MTTLSPFSDGLHCPEPSQIPVNADAEVTESSRATLPRMGKRKSPDPTGRVVELLGERPQWPTPLSAQSEFRAGPLPNDVGSAALTSWLWSQPLWLLVACTGLGLMLLGMALRHEA
jgi:hypothetical protein